MKYLPWVILLCGSTLSVSSAFAEDTVTCTTDLYNLGKCAGHEVVRGAEKAKEELVPPIHEAKIHVDAAGLVTLDMGHSVKITLEKAGSALADPWKHGFDDMDREHEDNQDAYHAVKDVTVATGKDIGKIGKGIWHGLKKIGGATEDGAIVIKAAEMKGFRDHPNTDEDLVGFVNAVGHGTKNVFVDMGHGLYKLFTKVKGKYVAKLDYIQQEEALKDVLANAKMTKVDSIDAQSNDYLQMQDQDRYEAKPMQAATEPAAKADASCGRCPAVVGSATDEPQQ